MPTESKVVQLLSKLTRETVRGHISWNASNPPSYLIKGTDYVIPIYFETNYNETKIGLAQRRRQRYFPHLDNFMWDEDIVILLIDRAGRAIWEHAEQSSAMQGLFDVVRESSADLDKIIGNILSDDGPSM